MRTRTLSNLWNPMSASDLSPAGGHRHLFAAIFAMLIWSTSFVATKLAYASFPPLTLGALRFVIAFVLLAAMATVKKSFAVSSRRDLLIMCGSGALGITLYFALENVGVSLTSASNAALIMASYPAITILMERIAYGVRVSRRKWAGVLLAIVGVALISGMQGGQAGDRQLLGNILLSVTGVVWALYNFSTRSVVNKYPAITVSFYQTLTGACLFLPLACFESSRRVAPDASSCAVLAYLGVFCSVVAFMSYNYGLRKLSAGTAVSLANLVPVFGVLLSVLVLGETLYPLQLLGGAIVIAGVTLSVRS